MLARPVMGTIFLVYTRSGQGLTGLTIEAGDVRYQVNGVTSGDLKLNVTPLTKA